MCPAPSLPGGERADMMQAYKVELLIWRTVQKMRQALGNGQSCSGKRFPGGSGLHQPPLRSPCLLLSDCPSLGSVVPLAATHPETGLHWANRIGTAGGQSRPALGPGRCRASASGPMAGGERSASMFGCGRIRRILPRVAAGIGGRRARLQTHTRTPRCGSGGALGDTVAINLWSSPPPF